MSNELVSYDDLGIPQPEESKQLTELSASTAYLPQLRVYGFEAAVVKEGLIPGGHLGLYYTKDKIIDLGEQTDVLVIHFRPRASVMLSDEQPVNYYDMESDNFNDVKKKGEEKVPGHQFGLEYLLYFATPKVFGMFFMGNPTLRRESDNVRSHVGKALTLKMKLIKTKKYTWHGCEAFGCDTPFDIPDKELMKETYNKFFANPKDSEVDLAESSDEDRAR